MTDATEISLMTLLGTHKNTQILNILLPLDDGTAVTIAGLTKALNSNGGSAKITEDQTRKYVDGLIKDNVLVRVEQRIAVNPKSKRVWALRNLLFAMYMDAAKNESLRKLGLD